LLRAALLVAAIGFADSLNPSTVGPAVYLAVARSAVRRILEFAAGVFTVSFVGGVLLLLGPGQLLLDALPHPKGDARHFLFLGAGVALIIAAVVMWLARDKLGRRAPPGSGGKGASSFIAGATLMLAELPTAFPYFGAIAVIIGSGVALPVQIAMLLVFNALFVAPMVAIALVVARVPGARTKVLEPAAAWLAAHWPVVFSGIALALGLALATVGVIGLGKG
jgi:cytochrome c biogenesis protein CcdA